MRGEIQRTILPATSGWFVAEPIHEQDDSIREVDWEQVIAWVVIVSPTLDGEEYADVYPVTVQGNHSDGDFVLRRPDGTYTIPSVQDFKEEAEVIAYLNEEAQNERKRREEKRHAR